MLWGCRRRTRSPSSSPSLFQEIRENWFQKIQVRVNQSINLILLFLVQPPLHSISPRCLAPSSILPTPPLLLLLLPHPFPLSPPPLGPLPPYCFSICSCKLINYIILFLLYNKNFKLRKILWKWMVNNLNKMLTIFDESSAPIGAWKYNFLPF